MNERAPRDDESPDIIRAAIAIAEMAARDGQLQRAERFLTRVEREVALRDEPE